MANSSLTTSLIFRLIDRVTGPIKRMVRGATDFEKMGKRASKAFELSANMKHGADAVEDFSKKAIGAIKKPLDVISSFEEQMSEVKASTFDLTKTMDASQIKLMDATMVDLMATARKLGSATKYSAMEAGEGMTILAKNFAGEDLKKAQDVMRAMPGILDTAAATRESIETAADIQTKTMNQFGLAANDMGRIGDVLVKTANSSATGLVDLGEALKYSGVTAKDANIDLETTAAMLGALGNAGKTGSVAGTALSSVLGNFQSGMKKQKSALAALGINIKDKKGNLRPILELLEQAQKAADKKFGKGKGGVRRDRWLQGLVGMGGDKEALAILMKQAGTGELQALVAANKAAAGTAAAVATEMSRNAVGASKELDSALEELQLTVGERVLPEFTELLKQTKEMTIGFTDWASAHPILIKGLSLVVALVGGFGIIAAPMIKGVAAMITMWGALTKAWVFAGRAATFLKAQMLLMKTGVVTSLKAIKVAAMASPFATFMALATVALLIYEYWEPISGFFSGLWDSITAGFKAALDWIIGKIQWAYDKVIGIRDALLAIDYDNTRAAAQQGQLAGMSQEQLRALQGMGGGVGALAGDTLKQQRATTAGLGKLGTQLGLAAAANGPPAASGAPLIQGEGPATSQFDGELKITVEGQVTKQQLKTRGDPGFRVRANVGRQAG